MRRLLLVALMGAAMSCMSHVATGQTCCVSKGQQSSALFGFEITAWDEITDDGVLRIGGILAGIPHTSCRIDRITLACGDKKVVAVDIDGIDFERYFQWEDDGEIHIEIDFPLPPLPKNMRECSLIFTTVRGDVSILVKEK